MQCFSRAYRSEWAGLALLLIAFSPLAVQAEDPFGVLPQVRLAVEEAPAEETPAEEKKADEEEEDASVPRTPAEPI